MGARSVPGQQSFPANRIDPMARAVRRSISCARTSRRRPAATRGATTSSSRPTSRSTTSTTIATKVDQNISEQDADVRPLRLQQAHRRRATPTASRAARRRTASCRSSASTTPASPTGCAPSVRRLVFNVRAGLNQYLELARSDPGLSFNPAELGFPSSLVNQLPNKVFPRLNFYHAPARPVDVPGRCGRQQPEQRNDDRLQPAAELLVERRASTTSAAASTCG